jgi:hypothetical protein
LSTSTSSPTVSLLDLSASALTPNAFAATRLTTSSPPPPSLFSAFVPPLSLPPQQLSVLNASTRTPSPSASQTLLTQTAGRTLPPTLLPSSTSISSPLLSTAQPASVCSPPRLVSPLRVPSNARSLAPARATSLVIPSVAATSVSSAPSLAVSTASSSSLASLFSDLPVPSLSKDCSLQVRCDRPRFCLFVVSSLGPRSSLHHSFNAHNICFTSRRVKTKPSSLLCACMHARHLSV